MDANRKGRPIHPGAAHMGHSYAVRYSAPLSGRFVRYVPDVMKFISGGRTLVPADSLFPCLGLNILGKCSYNPSHPYTTYFSLGNAVAALAFTLAIQQFLRPIYLFRLRSYRIKVWYLLALVLVGFACPLVAMILPNLPLSYSSPFEYPIVWEGLGAIFIAAAYCIATFISLRPAQIYQFNLIDFVRAGATLLSAADESEMVSFAEDLFAKSGENIARLINYASAWQRAQWAASALEFERLREIGAPLVIRGQPPISAFYLFAHRRDLERATYAGSFLRIIADPRFCSVLVRKCPWLTASTVNMISSRRLHVDQAEPFVQQIAAQALINDQSIMARESEYGGFGTAPVFSDSLFSDWFVLSQYDPLGRLTFEHPKEITETYLSRLNAAAQLILETAIKGDDFWPQRYMMAVTHAYEHVSQQNGYRRYKGLPADYLVSFHMGISKLCKRTAEALGELTVDRRKGLFLTDPKSYPSDLVHEVASIAYESLASIANAFAGPDDDCWIHAISVFNDVYSPYGTEPVGMNPLQQQLAIQLIDKLRQNLEGFYPAISRVLVSVIGPYESHTTIEGRTAFVVIRDAVYRELQKLSTLHNKKPDKFSNFLPSNVTFDPASNSLTHTYRGGDTKITNLGSLTIPEVNLFDPLNWDLV
ncbi:MAG TPA: hypothetical protein VGR52_02990 [Stellaceae bacterium]|nr:hypothetical protein [Stellaceae bacterium]